MLVCRRCLEKEWREGLYDAAIFHFFVLCEVCGQKAICVDVSIPVLLGTYVPEGDLGPTVHEEP
jgi:hypothetical protein